jgi:hypothetical protein
MTPVDRVLAITTVFLVLMSTSARAQSAEAEVLFRDGRTLIKNGKLAEGCAKIEASERIESSVGTLLNLGDCREKLGKVAGAWAAFRKAEATAKRANNDDKREDEARKRAISLEPKMSSLTIEVAQPVTGLVVKRDGEILDPALLNTAVPLDAGTYTIVAEAPGYTPWKTDVVLQFKSKLRTAIPALERSRVVAAVNAPPTVVYRKVHRTWSGTSAARSSSARILRRSMTTRALATTRRARTSCTSPVALPSRRRWRCGSSVDPASRRSSLR